MTSNRIDIFSQTEAAQQQGDLSRFTPKSRAGEGRPALRISLACQIRASS